MKLLELLEVAVDNRSKYQVLASSVVADTLTSRLFLFANGLFRHSCKGFKQIEECNKSTYEVNYYGNCAFQFAKFKKRIEKHSLAKSSVSSVGLSSELSTMMKQSLLSSESCGCAGRWSASGSCCCGASPTSVNHQSQLFRLLWSIVEYKFYSLVCGRGGGIYSHRCADDR